MPSLNVLVIDDDPNIRKLLLELLSGKPEYRVLIAGDGREAVACFAKEKIDVVLTDIHMPGFTGLELMADMQKIKVKPEILVMTANGTPENVEKARQIGARSIILKPFDNLDVVEGEIEKAARAARETAAARGDGNGHGAAA
ncbi:MAG TPA: response regulator, partial [Candidatus Polarisedimenticolia bacterium]|nr:response regulator [Candidatus Polarisedimenticolia bacterium]